MKLAIISNKRRLSGKLTKFFTDSYAYHTAWVDEEHGLVYDMSLLRRRRPWPHYFPPNEVTLHDFPEVKQDFLERKLTTDNDWYGVLDYCLFLIRPLYHLVGKSTRNTGGKICSEMINDDLWECGVHTPFKPEDEPPSPADLERWVATIGK